MKKLRGGIVEKLIMAVSILLILAVLTPILIRIVPDIVNIVKNKEYQQIEDYIKSFGAIGVAVALVLQILQVISVVIPSPVIWISVGAVYGTFWGMLICAGGMVLGNALVFLTARKFHLESDEKERKKLWFLSDIKNEELMILLMFLIPGMPNGIVPYICAGTQIPARRFLSIVTVSCIPSILFSTCIGDMALQGNHEVALTVLAVAAILAVLLAVFRKKIVALVQKSGKQASEK